MCVCVYVCMCVFVCVQTTDGGKTFTTMFNVSNQFYVRTAVCTASPVSVAV